MYWKKRMEWDDWLINEIQNWSFRIEDILLHSVTGMALAISLKIKKIFQSLKKLIFK